MEGFTIYFGFYIKLVLLNLLLRQLRQNQMKVARALAYYEHTFSLN